MPRISVNQFQFRQALLQQWLYDQFSSNLAASNDLVATLYYNYAPLLDSDNLYFTEANTTLTDEQRYAAFELAQTL